MSAKNLPLNDAHERRVKCAGIWGQVSSFFIWFELGDLKLNAMGPGEAVTTVTIIIRGRVSGRNKKWETEKPHNGSELKNEET